MPLTPLTADDPREIAGYPLLGRLGAGGMGVVYLGDGPSGQVAVKVVRPELADDPGFRARFHREVAAARRVSGACVVDVLAADPEAGTPYMVSEYVKGPDLATLVDRFGPLDPRRQHALAAGLAEALLSIHSAGLVHRDLKPANVLCAPRGLKVIDFGIASATDGASLTRTGLLVGSTGWMAPEQVHGAKVVPLSDVFCWASVVYFAATGRPPFGEGSPAAVLYRVVASEPDLNDPKIEPRLRPVLAAAFAKEPQRRPAAPDLLSYLLPRRDAAPAFQHQAVRPAGASGNPSSPPPMGSPNGLAHSARSVAPHPTGPPPSAPPPGYRPPAPLR